MPTQMESRKSRFVNCRTSEAKTSFIFLGVGVRLNNIFLCSTLTHSQTNSDLLQAASTPFLLKMKTKWRLGRSSENQKLVCCPAAVGINIVPAVLGPVRIELPHGGHLRLLPELDAWTATVVQKSVVWDTCQGSTDKPYGDRFGNGLQNTGIDVVQTTRHFIELWTYQEIWLTLCWDGLKWKRIADNLEAQHYRPSVSFHSKQLLCCQEWVVEAQNWYRHGQCPRLFHCWN